MNLMKRVFKSENNFTNLFSKSKDCGSFIRYYDDELKDMYDHNFSLLKESINEDSYQKMLEIKKERNEKHLKVSLDKSCPFLIEKSLKEEINLTMVKEDYKNFYVPSLNDVIYKRYRENKEIIKDVIELEKKYYGKEYGEDFCERRWLRYAHKVDEGDNGLDIWVVYDKDTPIAFAYSFYSEDVVAMDGLLVIGEYRHKYVASNLIKKIANHYECPIYLHADKTDTPKEMYQKLGFIIIAESYDYLLTE